MDRFNILSEHWDYLIVLDACRYDYFEQIHGTFLKGRLEKRISLGSCTNEWTNRTFPDYYDDIEYISANPQIAGELTVYGFCGGKHFHKVHEIWKNGWDNDKGTVLPETLTKAAIDIISNTPGKRFIIHYVQPHEPYLLDEIDAPGYDKGKVDRDRALIGSEKYGRFARLKKWLFKNLFKIIKRNRVVTNYHEWILRQLLHMEPKCAMDAVRRKYGPKMLQKAYADNLERALEQVAVLVKHLAGKIVITSDHGEFLGEGRRYAHPYGSLDPTVVEVPWLIIEKTGKDAQPEQVTEDQKPPAEPIAKTESETEKQELIRKLKSLGYYQ
ncbi:MAG: hypothetical protein ACYTFK_07455 [Planctomycetota bacterium]|jgi:hypothetical protein